jgi:hypothetical protein
MGNEYIKRPIFSNMLRNLPSTDSYLLSDGDIILHLRSTAGVTSVKILDSSTNVVASINSAGAASFSGLAATSDFDVTGSFSVNTDDFVVSVTSDISMKPTGGNFRITLGDAVGAKKLFIKDSANSTVATIDSDGTATVVKLTASSDISGQSVSATSNLSGVHVTASSNFVGTGFVQGGGGFVDSYLAKTTATVGTAITNKGFTSLAQANTTQVTWTLADPTAAGFTKTIFVLSQTGTTARTFILPASTKTVFSSSQGSTGRKITFDDPRESVSMVSASTTTWLVYNSQFATFGSS